MSTHETTPADLVAAWVARSVAETRYDDLAAHAPRDLRDSISHEYVVGFDAGVAHEAGRLALVQEMGQCDASCPRLREQLLTEHLQKSARDICATFHAAPKETLP